MRRLDDIEVIKRIFEKGYIDYTVGSMRAVGSNWSHIYNQIIKSDTPDYTNFRDQLPAFIEWVNSQTDVFKPVNTPNKSEQNWYYAESRDFEGEKNHRLYIGTQNRDTLVFARKLIEKCIDKNVPFNFKFGYDGSRSDKVVIYSTDEQLIQYIDVLNEIKQENPDLISRCSNVPVTTIPVDGWIGYGVENQSSKNGSFNENTSKACLLAFRKTMLDNIDNMDLNLLDEEIFTESFITSHMSYLRNVVKDSSREIDFQIAYGRGSTKRTELLEFFKRNKTDLVSLIKNNNIDVDKLELDGSEINFNLHGQRFDIRPSAIIDSLKNQYPVIVKKIGEENFLEQLKNNTDMFLRRKGVDISLPYSLESFMSIGISSGNLDRTQELKSLKAEIMTMSETKKKSIESMDDIRKEYVQMFNESYSPLGDDDASKGTINHGMPLPTVVSDEDNKKGVRR